MLAELDDDKEILPNATQQEIAEIMMSDVVGEYDVPDSVLEWAWVEKVASYAHVRNAQDGIWEFVLNLSNHWDDIPATLAPVIAQARKAGNAYLIIHQGT